jgi:hypothetical protein
MPNIVTFLFLTARLGFVKVETGCQGHGLARNSGDCSMQQCSTEEVRRANDRRES